MLREFSATPEFGLDRRQSQNGEAADISDSRSRFTESSPKRRRERKVPSIGKFFQMENNFLRIVPEKLEFGDKRARVRKSERTMEGK